VLSKNQQEWSIKRIDQEDLSIKNRVPAWTPDSSPAFPTPGMSGAKIAHPVGMPEPRADAASGGIQGSLRAAHALRSSRQ